MDLFIPENRFVFVHTFSNDEPEFFTPITKSIGDPVPLVTEQLKYSNTDTSSPNSRWCWSVVTVYVMFSINSVPLYAAADTSARIVVVTPLTDTIWMVTSSLVIVNPGVDGALFPNLRDTVNLYVPVSGAVNVSFDQLKLSSLVSTHRITFS